MEPTMSEAEAAYSSVYERHALLIRFLKGPNTSVPKGLVFCGGIMLERED